MTSEEKRLKIAKFIKDPIKEKHCWSSEDDGRYYKCYDCGETVGYLHVDDKENIGPCCGTERDYPNSLDAMKYAESMLSDLQQNNYSSDLCDIVYNEVTEDSKLFALINASAEQKSDAFIKL